MDIITMHVFFSNIYGSREETFHRLDIFSLHDHIVPTLELQPKGHGFKNLDKGLDGHHTLPCM